MPIDWIVLNPNIGIYHAHCTLCFKTFATNLEAATIDLPATGKRIWHDNLFCTAQCRERWDRWMRSQQVYDITQDYQHRADAYQHFMDEFDGVPQLIPGLNLTFKPKDPGPKDIFVREATRKLHDNWRSAVKTRNPGARHLAPVRYKPPKIDKRKTRYKKYRGSKRVLTPKTTKKRRLSKPVIP